MDLSFTDEQLALRALARQIFSGMCADERLREIEAGPERYDPALWTAMARAGLLGFGTPEADGGNGGGMIEVCVLLEEAGRAAAPAPLWAALVTGALPLARFGTDEQRARLLRPMLEGGPPVVAALEETNAITVADGRADGTLTLVPAAARAAALIVPAAGGLYLLDPAGAVVEGQDEPSGEPLYAVTLRQTPAEKLAPPEAIGWMRDRALTGLCAFQTGLCDAAVRLTARYTSGREQFGKPLATFQAVQQRAADAYIDLEVIRWTMWQAAWRLDAGLPATEETVVAAYFASAGAARALEAAQHLHGGIGVDMDYPLHRYRLLAHGCELSLGGAWSQLARLGALMAR